MTIARPLLPIRFKILELKIKHRKVMRHRTEKTDTVTRIPVRPPDAEKFIAVAMVPGPARRGTAKGDTAISDSSTLFAEWRLEHPP